MELKRRDLWNFFKKKTRIQAGSDKGKHKEGPLNINKENFAWSSGDLSGTDAVEMWVDEKANYGFNSNSLLALNTLVMFGIN
jgi:hypothetical protein